jgi:hydroxylaminobenzene mutase
LLIRQGHRLLQLGVVLFLFAALEGFVIPALPVPKLGLSVHSLAALQGVMFLALGLVWPKLQLGAVQMRIAFWGYLAAPTFLVAISLVLWGLRQVDAEPPPAAA